MISRLVLLITYLHIIPNLPKAPLASVISRCDAIIVRQITLVVASLAVC